MEEQGEGFMEEQGGGVSYGKKRGLVQSSAKI